WLADPRTSQDGTRISVRATVPVTSTSPYYGQLSVRLKQHGAKYDIVVHAVFLDTLSLLEPTPGRDGRSVDFSTSFPLPARYEPLGGLVDDFVSRLATIAGDVTGQIAEDAQWEGGGCRARGSASLCEAHTSCPFAQNARWLRDLQLRERFLDA